MITSPTSVFEIFPYSSKCNEYIDDETIHTRLFTCHVGVVLHTLVPHAYAQHTLSSCDQTNQHAINCRVSLGDIAN